MSFWKFNKSPMFEGEGTGGASAPAPAAPVVEATPPQAEPASRSQQLSQIWDKSNNVPVNVQPTAEPAPAQLVESPVQAPVVDNPAPEKILGKYENQGELIKAFQSLQGTYTKDHQAYLDTQKVLEQERTAKADLEAKIQTLSKPPVQQVPTPEIDEYEGLEPEARLEKFYADPAKYDQHIEDKAFARAEKFFNEKLTQLESKLNPIVERTEQQRSLEAWTESTESFKAANPDMLEFVPGMQKYIAENNLRGSKDHQKVLTDALTYAKGLNATQIQTDTAAKIAEYEAKIQEYETKLKISKEETIKEYVAGVRNSQNQLPISITGQSNSGSPAMPPVSLKGKPMNDVHNAAADMIFGAR